MHEPPPDDREPAPSALDPDLDALRAMGAEALEWVVQYHASLRDRPVYPRTTAGELRALLDEPLPREGRAFSQLLAAFRDVIVPGSRQNAHPRSLGYVTAPGVAVAALADLLASTLNANVTSWRSAPAAARVERLTIGWIKEALGLDPGADGLFVSGGSMANLCALAAARERHCGGAVTEEGMRAWPGPLRVYVSEEAHHSIDKAAALLGIGRASVRRIAVDDRFRMDVRRLRQAIEEDRATGADPFCVVASAGTVVTGAVDAVAEIAEVARGQGLWTHVDGAYGGFAALAPSARPLFAGLADADSVALDPHKWLYLPADCGCVLYRDPAGVRPAFRLGADYTRILETDAEEAFAFWDYGPELSRRFRALKVWMVLAQAGARAVAEAIEGNLDCARHLARLVDEDPGFERLAPVELSIVCFRWVPPALRSGLPRPEEEERRLDALNERVLVALQRGGSSYVSNASVRGRFALRACVLNYRTTRRDMEVLLEDVRRAAAGIT